VRALASFAREVTIQYEGDSKRHNDAEDSFTGVRTGCEGYARLVSCVQSYKQKRETRVESYLPTCPFCGNPVSPDWEHCAHCGRKIPVAIQSTPNVKYAARAPYEEPSSQPVRPTSVTIAAMFFFVGAFFTLLVHEAIHIALIEHFGGLVTGVRILGFLVEVTDVFSFTGFAGWSWTGDIADVEGFFPVLPAPGDLWLVHWMPEVIGLISAILILIVFVKWKVDDPKLFGFLLGVLAMSVLGLTAVAVSLI